MHSRTGALSLLFAVSSVAVTAPKSAVNFSMFVDDQLLVCAPVNQIRTENSFEIPWNVKNDEKV